MKNERGMKRPKSGDWIKCPKCGKMGEAHIYLKEKFDLIVHEVKLEYGIPHIKKSCLVYDYKDKK